MRATSRSLPSFRRSRRSHEEALQAYLELGPQRSLNQLHRERPHLASRRTLTRWSQRHDWPRRAAERDRAQENRRRLRREVIEALIKIAVGLLVGVISSLMRA